MDGDAYGDVTLKNYVFFGGNYQGASVNFFPGKVVTFNAGPFNYSYVKSLASGFQIDGSSVGPSFFGSMAYGAGNPNAQFNSVNGAYLATVVCQRQRRVLRLGARDHRQPVRHVHRERLGV